MTGSKCSTVRLMPERGPLAGATWNLPPMPEADAQAVLEDVERTVADEDLPN